MAGPAAAFDRLAARYDELWTTTPAGRLQRDAVWRNVSHCFRAHQHILDLGCGTGEDGRWLQSRGISVTAIDASPAMVAEARKHGLDARVLKIEELDRLTGKFDGILSNFGAFNCIERPSEFRTALAAQILPGGYLALCVIGRFCLWETLWHALRGQCNKAKRRWKGSASAATLGIHVTYHTVSQLRAAFAPDFELTKVVGIGIAVPPSYITQLPGLISNLLGAIDYLIERLPFISALADHRLLIFRRK
jgi:2-polyprenyl-3-methyl-5-hydroxy-6-metoxy-1,4-benzoquinol methylase